MRWWVFFWALLLVPSVSALSITGCPSQVQSGQSFQVTVTQSGAAYVGVDNGTGIADSQAGESAQLTLSVHVTTLQNNYKIYGAYKNTGDTSWTYDTVNAVCSIKVTPADHPASVPIQASTHSTTIGASFWVESYNAQDADGINRLALSRSLNGGSFVQVYPIKYCNGQSTCSNLWYPSQSQAGTYEYKVTLTDENANTYNSASWTVTVTDPCENYNCDDGNACTTDECVAVNGQPSCQHTALNTGSWCGSGKYCTDDSPPACLPSCPVPNKCFSSQPANTQQVAYYCTAPQECYACESGFHWEGNDCVADISCSDECSSGEMQCSDTDHEQSCVLNSTSGCWEWDAPVACPQGETCTGGACTDPCTGLPTCSDAENGHERCNANVVETCGQPDGTCWQWTTTQSCAAPTPYCVQSGNAASCVACRDDSDCNAGEVCSSGSCCADSDGDGVCDTPECSDASECTNNPYDPECSLVQCTSGACDYSTANDGASCTLVGGAGVCLNGDCVVTCQPSTETCNGLDDDCDGIADEGCDDDNDGFCDAAMMVTTPPPSICPDGGGDCDDNNPAVNPSEAEICGDSIDNNCNNLIDGQDTTLPERYSDKDGDTWGAGTAFADRCVGCTSGGCSGPYANRAGDCNDDWSIIGMPHPIGWYANPGYTTETASYENACFDTIDNDCDNSIDSADPDCETITCDFGECGPVTTTALVWDRVGQTCVEEEVLVTTISTGPYCGDGVCEYTSVDIDQEPTGQTRFKVDGTFCTDGTVGYCLAGACLAECPSDAGCHATQPANTNLVTSFSCPVGESCYECREGWYWAHDECREEEYSIEVESVIATAGDTFIVTPTTYDFRHDPVSNVLYRYSGFRTATTNQPYTIITQPDEVGTHTLFIAASRVTSSGEEPLATTSVEIGLLCPENLACCPAGSLQFADYGTACDLNGAPGFCDRLGTCQPVCGAQIVLENSAAKCSDGVDNDCDGALDCIRGPDGEYETSCDQYCSAFCEYGEMACDGSCVDLSTDRNNCGDCGNRCASDEQCDQGRCTEMPGCFVACESDAECGDGQTCALPGTCDAYCEEIPVLVMNETAQQELLTAVVRQKTYELTKELTPDTLVLTVKNLITVPLENFTMTITLPKEVIGSASMLSSDSRYEIVHDDPVIRTTIPVVKNEESVAFYFDQPVDPELVENIIVSAQHNLIELSSAGMLNNDDLVITRSFREDEKGTTVTLTLKPGLTLENVRIPLEIPKCLANSISELTFDNENFVIINDDPLMVWTFDELASKKSISFTVPKGIDNDCREQLKAFGMASGKRKPISPWLPLAIIPVIGFILLFFQRFHESGAKRHLSRNEFYQLAKQQGQSDSDIEKAWHEYKRKF